MSRIGSRAVVGLVFAAAAATLLAQRSIEEQLPPKPARYVTDNAGALPADRAEALNSKLEQYERDTSNQILVWIDRSVPENFTLEDFAVRAFKKWGVGQAKKDNGAALFVFVNDRKLRTASRRKTISTGFSSRKRKLLPRAPQISRAFHSSRRRPTSST